MTSLNKKYSMTKMKIVKNKKLKMKKFKQTAKDNSDMKKNYKTMVNMTIIIIITIFCFLLLNLINKKAQWKIPI